LLTFAKRLQAAWPTIKTQMVLSHDNSIIASNGQQPQLASLQ